MLQDIIIYEGIEAKNYLNKFKNYNSNDDINGIELVVEVVDILPHL